MTRGLSSQFGVRVESNRVGETVATYETVTPTMLSVTASNEKPRPR